MTKLVAALLLLVSVAGAAQAQAAEEQKIAPGTTGQYSDYPEWAQKAFEPKN
jgi:hypothetical protein